jgi:hypothetical protein
MQQRCSLAAPVLLGRGQSKERAVGGKSADFNTHVTETEGKNRARRSSGGNRHTSTSLACPRMVRHRTEGGLQSVRTAGSAIPSLFPPRRRCENNANTYFASFHCLICIHPSACFRARRRRHFQGQMRRMSRCGRAGQGWSEAAGHQPKRRPNFGFAHQGRRRQKSAAQEAYGVPFRRRRDRCSRFCEGSQVGLRASTFLRECSRPRNARPGAHFILRP